MKHPIFGLLLSILLPVQAASAALPDPRYEFNDLEQVASFAHWNIRGWQVIDARSLIVETSASRSYLLILDHDIPALRFSEQIHISSANSMVNAGFDDVIVRDRFSRPARIQKIYLLNGRDVRQDARARILNR